MPTRRERNAYRMTRADDMRRLQGRQVVASVSGGKDSTALALYLQDRGVTFRAVWMDTGWEHPATVEYVTQVLPKVLGQPVEVINPPLPFVDLVRKKGMFPGRTVRFCTQELKIKPFEKWVQDNYGDEIVVNAIGIRASESHARANLGRWSVESGLDSVCVIWRPLINWTVADVIAIHQRHAIKPNRLYLPPINASRVGCWPCIYAKKAEIETVERADPARISAIRQLEAEIQDKASSRYAARGETFSSLGYRVPTFFARKIKGHDATPIDVVLDWARQGRGSIDEGEVEDGCVRWGMCDLPDLS